MKRLLLTLGLLVSLAGASLAAGYHVKTTGSTSNNGLTPNTPTTWDWAVDNAQHGDTVYVYDGTYTGGPWYLDWNGGNYPDRLTIVGNIANPGNVVFANDIGLRYFTDYNGHYGHDDVTIKGFRCNSIDINSNKAGSGAAKRDSIAYFIADSSFTAGLQDSCVVMNGKIGSNGSENLFNLGEADATPFSVGNIYKDLQVYTGLNNQSANNLFSIRKLYQSEFTRIRSFPILWASVAAGNHTGFFGGNQYSTVTDCLFYPTNNGAGEKYALNCREQNVGNVWVRDTVMANPASTSPLKIEFATSGTLTEAAHGNLYDHCYFKATGALGYQNGCNYDTHQFNQFILPGPFIFPGGTDTLNYLTLRHNTFVTDAGEIFHCADSTQRYAGIGNTIVSNLFVCRSLGSGPHLRLGWWAGAGTCDSNLVAAVANDSTKMYDYDYNHKGNRWAGTSTYWGRPIYATGPGDSNLRPDSTSIAVSSDLWPDGYVGAIAGGATPGIFITQDQLPVAYINTAYTYTLLARNDNVPDTWAITSGALPTGLTLGEFTGAISGTPTESGDFDFTVQVTDDQLFTATKAFHLNVSPNPGPIRPKHPGFH